jgi:anti-sigma factor RsiW
MSPRVLDCTEVRSALPLYSGGDLHPDREAALDRHLSTCADCRAHAVRANSAREALLGGFARERAGGVDLWPALRGALVEQGAIRPGVGPVSVNRTRESVSRPSTPPVRRIDPRWRWLSIGAAAAAALLAGLWIQRSVSEPSRAQLVPEMVAQDPSVHEPLFVDPVAPTSPALVVTPVTESHGLRRVQPGEPRWSESADVYGLQPAPMSPWSSNVGSPVSLQRVGPGLR